MLELRAEREDAVSITKRHASGVGQRHPARGLIEEPHADPFFQRADPVR